jgi:hypothetical protein
MLPTHASHVFVIFAPVTHGSCAHDPTTYAPRASLDGAIALGTSSRLVSETHDAAATANSTSATRAYISHLRRRRPHITAYTGRWREHALIFKIAECLQLFAYHIHAQRIRISRRIAHMRRNDFAEVDVRRQ